MLSSSDLPQKCTKHVWGSFDVFLSCSAWFKLRAQHRSHKDPARSQHVPNIRPKKACSSGYWHGYPHEHALGCPTQPQHGPDMTPKNNVIIWVPAWVPKGTFTQGQTKPQHGRNIAQKRIKEACSFGYRHGYPDEHST